MTAIISAAVIFVVFAVGDMISAKTKAIVSMLLVASVVFLAGFWTGVFPTTLFAVSYTHLDVSKRQSPRSWIVSWALPRVSCVP